MAMTKTRPTTTDVTVAFLSAVAKYRTTYWSREFIRLPAIEANRRCDDMAGLRFFRATAGGKRAALLLVDAHWPHLRGLPDRARFVRAVRESALGCLR
jgi:hypothetical protein